ncbi:MAG TPA: hypothetical protein PKN33_18950 [Phycisphaerae bacterium]|nr:hypothetical protein [Phycisphaerae bacterium]
MKVGTALLEDRDMHIHCPHCGKPISADNVNLESAIAKCSNCHAVFGIRDAVEQDSQRHSRNHRIREPVAMPAGFTIEERNGNREIGHRWFTPLYYFLLFFCVFWDGFIIFLYAYAFEKAEVPWFVKLFPILHVGAGVVLTYFRFSSKLVV